MFLFLMCLTSSDVIHTYEFTNFLGFTFELTPILTNVNSTGYKLNSTETYNTYYVPPPPPPPPQISLIPPYNGQVYITYL